MQRPITTICPGVFQVKDDFGVYFTILQGKESALIWDTGHGLYPTKDFIDTFVTTPYQVLLSHGHPDHVLGSLYFKEVWISNEDYSAAEKFFSSPSREDVLKSAKENSLISEDAASAYLTLPSPILHPLTEGMTFDLGGITAETYAFPGHTHGSMGLLLKETGILLSGDAFNDYLWLFSEEATSPDICANSVKKALSLPFTHYLGGHIDQLTKKEHLTNLAYHLEHLRCDPATKQTLLSTYEVVQSTYTDEMGTTVIFLPASILEP